jgi:hypothetical protein
MKKCGRCGLEKPSSEFHHWNRSDGRQPWCKPCRQTYDHDYHARNRERRRQQVKERRRRLHAWNNELKSSMPCADCGQFFPPVAMTWDHLPGSEKITEVSNLVRAGKTLQARKEVEKCELVCANCHAVRSYDRLTGRSSAW